MGTNVQELAREEPVAVAAIAVALGALATVLGAWFFQYVLHYPPCALCLDERVPYYFSIPLAAVIAAGAAARWPGRWLALGLAAIASAMLYNAGLGVYHAGIEWKWWAGPQSCSGTFNAFSSSANLLERVQSGHLVRCDEAAWRFLGVSLAGWNALISLALSGIAGAGAWAAWRQGSSSLSQ
ncbi:MAG TPA: disulfide bond formation protein B [Xanthobacteraceae bacterium]|nr:disulfide bond formation protein B [Xanthobacteraceae bacterium]